MVATIAIRVFANTISAPAGWTAVPGLNNGDTPLRMTSFWKKATAGDLAGGVTYQFGLGATLSRAAGGIVAYGGVDTASPIDPPAVATATSNGTASATATAPAVSTTNLRAK